MVIERPAVDPKGLIAESYRMEDIGPEECRSVFLDWALSLDAEVDVPSAIRTLLDWHGREGHPMTEVLRQGLAVPPTPTRRGGRGGRLT